MALSSKREVFVLESNGVPTRVELADYNGAGQLAIAAEAGVRVGVPVGQERVVRYVPEHANLWLFQANENWTETQLTNTGPVQPLLQKSVDGEPWTFSLYFIATDWDAAKRLVDEIQGHRVGSYVEHTAPEPKTLKERRLTVAQASHKFKSGKRYVNHCSKCGLERGKYNSGNYQYMVDGKWQSQVPMCSGKRVLKEQRSKHLWDWLKFDDPRYARWAEPSANITNVPEIKVCKRCGQVVRVVRERYGADRHKMVREHLKMDSDVTIWIRGNKVCTK